MFSSQGISVRARAELLRERKSRCHVALSEVPVPAATKHCLKIVTSSVSAVVLISRHMPGFKNKNPNHKSLPPMAQDCRGAVLRMLVRV